MDGETLKTARWRREVERPEHELEQRVQRLEDREPQEDVQQVDGLAPAARLRLAVVLEVAAAFPPPLKYEVTASANIYYAAKDARQRIELATKGTLDMRKNENSTVQGEAEGEAAQ